MTLKLVNERDLPFDKPFFLLKLSKGLCPVANWYTVVAVTLFINSFFIDTRNQPLNTEFNITHNKHINKGWFCSSMEKDYINKETYARVYQFVTGHKLLLSFRRKKGLSKGRSRSLTNLRVISLYWEFITLRFFYQWGYSSLVVVITRKVNSISIVYLWKISQRLVKRWELFTKYSDKYPKYMM